MWRRVVCSQASCLGLGLLAHSRGFGWGVELCTTELPAVPLLTGLQRSGSFCEAASVSERSLMLL